MLTHLWVKCFVGYKASLGKSIHNTFERTQTKSQNYHTACIDGMYSTFWKIIEYVT